MGDHNEISKLVFDCSFHATLPLYETGRPHHAAVTPIYFMDTIMGLGFQPTEYVDITATIETKVGDARGAREPAHVARATTTASTSSSRCRRRPAGSAGSSAASTYAEGFVPCLTWLRGTTRRLLP